MNVKMGFESGNASFSNMQLCTGVCKSRSWKLVFRILQLTWHGRRSCVQLTGGSTS